MTKALALAALVALSALSGCGTILHGPHEDLEIRSRPEKAQVWIDGVQQGETPTKVALAVNTSHVVVIKAPGYKDQTVRTDSMLNAGYVAIDILLALVPVIVDAATGSWYKLAPSPMNVILQPEGAAAPSPVAGATP
jgi:hypothetical protein